MTKKLWIIVGSGIGTVILVASLLLYSSFTGFPDPKDIKADLRNQMIPVPDQEKLGQFNGWYFDPTDDLDVKVLDYRREDYKKIFYVQITAKAQDGQVLNGIAEIYYISIARQPYIVALSSINLQVSHPQTPPVKPKLPPASSQIPAPPQTKPAQQLK